MAAPDILESLKYPDLPPLIGGMSAPDLVVIWKDSDGKNYVVTYADFLAGVSAGVVVDLDLGDLGDVTLASQVNNQVLTYNSATFKWENKKLTIGMIDGLQDFLDDFLARSHNEQPGLDGGDPENDFFGHLTEEELERVQNLPENTDSAIDEIEERLDEIEERFDELEEDIAPFEGYTPETLPISSTQQEALDLKANIEDLHPVAFSGDYDELENKPIPDYPFNMNWTYDGSTKDIHIPEDYYLADVVNIRFIDLQLPRDNISYVPKPLENKIVLGELWTPEINTKLYLDLRVLKDL